MDIHESWEKALKNTEIIRPRVQGLMTFKDTSVPYIFLSESSVNFGDTVVRKGEVIVERPSLILPPHSPQLDGFELGERFNENYLFNFLLVRGIQLPSMRYNNTTNLLDIFEGGLAKAIGYYKDQLQQTENVSAGLVTGPEDVWQFSVLIYCCSQIARSADIDIRKLLDEYRKKD